jgi:ubiquinone/menaquinone biosynthesis C-methylase UbiE
MHLYIKQHKKIREEYWYNEFNKNSYEELLIGAYRSPCLDYILKYSKKKDAIVEGGCSDGRYLEILRFFNYKKIYGFEFDRKLLNLAKKKGLNVKLGNILSIPYKTNSFDIYLELGVIEHFELTKQKQILLDINRILKKKGLMIIDFSYLNLIRTVLYPFLKLKNEVYFKNKRGYSFHQYIYSKKFMCSLILKAGFKIVEFHSYGPRAIIIAQKK